MIGMELECWNNGIVECWVFHVPTNCPELGLFRTSNFTLQTSSKIGFVCTTPHVPRPPGPGPPGFARKLALFFQCSLQVRSAITPFPQTTCHSFCRGQNWVCLAQKPLVPRPAGPVPPGPAGNWLCFARLASPWAPSPRYPILPKFGFVFPVLFAGPLSHNSFPANHLHSSCRGQNWVCLATGHSYQCPQTPILPKFGFVFPVLFAGQLSHNSFPANHLPLRLAVVENWVCLAQKPIVPMPRRPRPTRPNRELALFGTVGIALEWWNDGILE